MNTEVPVIDIDGSLVASRRHLIDQLQSEAAAGTLRVNLYRGTETYGPEAFYTLSDGTVLHEVNGWTEDGSDYRYLMLVMHEPQPRGLPRWLSKAIGSLLAVLSH